ncbi:MAG TPA: hypothetical protein VK650_07625 [Steroidobacteraceae bacterium]|jgi:hypothetical protein|nr:hypothetical protein [Steroidobacteraceae bacterium]
MQTRRNSSLAVLFLAGLLSSLPAGVVLAQAAAPAAGTAPANMPRPEELEPGVDTSKSMPAPAAPEPGSAPAASTPPAAPPRATAAANAAAPKAAAGAKAAGKKGPDRLELETTDVTGNSELPKVLYIVPWKRSDLGDMVGRPVNSLLDEVLQPLDRDVFNRQNRYYDALKPENAGAKSDAAQGSGVKP